jgi:hypothetical protein
MHPGIVEDLADIKKELEYLKQLALDAARNTARIDIRLEGKGL